MFGMNELVEKHEVAVLCTAAAEALSIAQEECAEVIQAVSKIQRFGLNNSKGGEAFTNREHLEEEIGDMLAMVDILVDLRIVNVLKINDAKSAKIQKLKTWSSIFKKAT